MVKFSWDREGAFTMVACDAVLFYAERTLALVHVVAFASLLMQWKGLFGSTGIVPWKVSNSYKITAPTHTLGWSPPTPILLALSPADVQPFCLSRRTSSNASTPS